MLHKEQTNMDTDSIASLLFCTPDLTLDPKGVIMEATVNFIKAVKRIYGGMIVLCSTKIR